LLAQCVNGRSNEFLYLRARDDRVVDDGQNAVGQFRLC